MRPVVTASVVHLWSLQEVMVITVVEASVTVASVAGGVVVTSGATVLGVVSVRGQ